MTYTPSTELIIKPRTHSQYKKLCSPFVHKIPFFRIFLFSYTMQVTSNFGASVSITILWILTPCRFVGRHKRFGETYFAISKADRISTLRRNVMSPSSGLKMETYVCFFYPKMWFCTYEFTHVVTQDNNIVILTTVRIANLIISKYLSLFVVSCSKYDATILFQNRSTLNCYFGLDCIHLSYCDHVLPSSGND